MNSISTFDTGWCDVIVKRTKRRNSVSIKVKEGLVQINIPQRMSAIDVQLLLEKRRHWIEHALQKQQSAKLETSKSLEPGELFLFQGKRYPLRLDKGASFLVDISDDNHLCLTCPNISDKTSLFKRLLMWYQQQAVNYLTAKTDYYAQRLGHHPASITVKSYRSRWGSCSLQGDIQYNWRLIMAPPEVIDYVVVHELSHLIEHNHSQRFWQIVSKLDEHFQVHRQWLKQHGDFLHLQLAKT